MKVGPKRPVETAARPAPLEITPGDLHQRQRFAGLRLVPLAQAGGGGQINFHVSEQVLNNEQLVDVDVPAGLLLAGHELAEGGRQRQGSKGDANAIAKVLEVRRFLAFDKHFPVHPGHPDIAAIDKAKPDQCVHETRIPWHGMMVKNIVGPDASDEPAPIAYLQPVGVLLDQHRAGGAVIRMGQCVEQCFPQSDLWVSAVLKVVEADTPRLDRIVRIDPLRQALQRDW